MRQKKSHRLFLELRRDGVTGETVFCGSGTDTVRADKGDFLFGCEIVL